MKKIKSVKICIICGFFFSLFGCAHLGRKAAPDYVLYNNYAVRAASNYELWNEARFWLEKARELNQENACIHNNLGVVYEYLGLKEEARSSYKMAKELDPKSKTIQKNLSLFEESFKSEVRN